METRPFTKGDFIGAAQGKKIISQRSAADARAAVLHRMRHSRLVQQQRRAAKVVARRRRRNALAAASRKRNWACR